MSATRGTRRHSAAQVTKRAPLISSDMNATLNHAPNLAQRPPRSPRAASRRLVVLRPHLLDKGRAEIAGTAGEYKYNNPGDYHWFRFSGITPEALKAELATDKGDGECLAWIQEKRANKHTPWEIQQWSAYFSERGPDSDVETLEMFAGRIAQFNKTREDVKTCSTYSTSTITSPLVEARSRVNLCGFAASLASSKDCSIHLYNSNAVRHFFCGRFRQRTARHFGATNNQKRRTNDNHSL